MLDRIRQMVRQRTDTLMRTVLKNSSWAAGGQMVNAAEMMLETLLIARYFPLEVFGLFIVVVSAVDLVFGLLDFRTGQALIKFLPGFDAEEGKKRSSAFIRLMLAIDLTIGVVGFGGILLFGGLIDRLSSVEGDYLGVLAILAGGAALRAVVRSAGSYLRVSGAFVASVKLGVLWAVLRLGLVAGVIVLGPTLVHLAWGVALSDLLFFVMMAWAALRITRRQGHTPWRGSVREIRAERREIWGFLLSTNIESTVRTLSNKLDVLLIAAIGSTGAVAVYKVATRIAGSLLLFSDPLLMAVYPEMAQLSARNELSRLRRLLRMMTVGLGLLSGVGLVVFGLFGEWILRTAAGAKYAESFSVALIMFAGTALATVFFWARPMLLVQGRARSLVGVVTLAAAIEFALIALLTPSLGANGAAVGYGAFYATSALTCLFLLKGSSDIRMPANDATVKS